LKILADFPPKKAPISCGAGIKKEKKKAPKKGVPKGTRKLKISD